MFQKEPDAIRGTDFFVGNKEQLDGIVRHDTVFHKGKRGKDRRYESLLIVFHAAAEKLSVFFNDSPGVAVPFGKIARRYHVEVGHDPDSFAPSAGYGYHKIGPETRRNAGIGSVKPLA